MRNGVIGSTADSDSVSRGSSPFSVAGNLLRQVPYFIGVWLSLVERYVRDVEVASSNLVTPIYLWIYLNSYRLYYFGARAQRVFLLLFSVNSNFFYIFLKIHFLCLFIQKMLDFSIIIMYNSHRLIAQQAGLVELKPQKFAKQHPKSQPKIRKRAEKSS